MESHHLGLVYLQLRDESLRESKRSSISTFYGQRLGDTFNSSDEGSEDDVSATTDSDSTEDDGQMRSYLVGFSNGLCDGGGLATIAEDAEEDSGPEYSGHWMFSADNTDTDSVIHLPQTIPQLPDMAKLDAILNKSDDTSSDDTLIITDDEKDSKPNAIITANPPESLDPCSSLIDAALEECFSKTNDEIFDMCSLEACETVSADDPVEFIEESTLLEFNTSATTEPFEQLSSPESAGPSECNHRDNAIKTLPSSDSEAFSSSDESPLKRVAIRDSITTKRKSKRPRRPSMRTRQLYPSTSSEDDTEVHEGITRDASQVGEGYPQECQVSEPCDEPRGSSVCSVTTPEEIIASVKQLSLIRPYSMGDIRIITSDSDCEYLRKDFPFRVRGSESRETEPGSRLAMGGHHSHILRSKRPAKPKRYQSLYNPDLSSETWHQGTCSQDHVTQCSRKNRPKPLSLDMAEEFLSQENIATYDANEPLLNSTETPSWNVSTFKDNDSNVYLGGATVKIGVPLREENSERSNVAKSPTTPHAARLPSAHDEFPVRFSSQFHSNSSGVRSYAQCNKVNDINSDLRAVVLPNVSTEMAHCVSTTRSNERFSGDHLTKNGDQNYNKISHKVTFSPAVQKVNWQEPYDEPDDTDFNFTQLEEKQVRVKIMPENEHAQKLRPIVTTVPPKSVEGLNATNVTAKHTPARSGPIWQRLKLVKIGTPKGPRPIIPPKPASLSPKTSDGEKLSESSVSSPDEVSKKSSPRFFSWGSKRDKKKSSNSPVVSVDDNKNIGANVLSETKVNVSALDHKDEIRVQNDMISIENKENFLTKEISRGQQSLRDVSDRSSSGVTSPTLTLSPVDSDSAFEDNISCVSSDAKPPLPPSLTRIHPNTLSKAKLVHARRQYFNRQAAAKAELKQTEPVKIVIPENSSYRQPKQRSAAERLRDRFEQFSKSARQERERLASSTPDLSLFEGSVRRPSIDSRKISTFSSGSGSDVCDQSTQEHDLAPRDTGHLTKTLNKEFQRASLRCRTRSIGILETDLDTGKSREFLHPKETNLDDVYQDIQDLLDSFPQYLANNKLSEKRAKSLLHLDGSPASVMQNTLGTSEDNRARSMEFLLDDDNRASVQAPENELQKGGERKMSEAELKVRRSLQRLDIPNWMKNSQAPQQGFLLRRNTAGPQTSTGWTGLNSKTGSMSSLGSRAAPKVNLSTRMSTRSYGGVTSPVSPSASDRSTSFSYPFSRWSTSRLNSGTTTPTGSVSSQKTYSRQPYLGWRSNTSLLSLAGSQSSLSGGAYLTPAERLALSLAPKKPSPEVPDRAPSAISDRGDTISADGSRASDVQSSIKEVTSAIVHYCSASPHSSPKLSPKRRVWVESSFVGAKPILSPGTPSNSILTPTTINGHQEDVDEVRSSHSPDNYCTVVNSFGNSAKLVGWNSRLQGPEKDKEKKEESPNKKYIPEEPKKESYNHREDPLRRLDNFSRPDSPLQSVDLLPTTSFTMPSLDSFQFNEDSPEVSDNGVNKLYFLLTKKESDEKSRFSEGMNPWSKNSKVEQGTSGNSETWKVADRLPSYGFSFSSNDPEIPDLEEMTDETVTLDDVLDSLLALPMASRTPSPSGTNNELSERPPNTFSTFKDPSEDSKSKDHRYTHFRNQDLGPDPKTNSYKKSFSYSSGHASSIEEVDEEIRSPCETFYLSKEEDSDITGEISEKPQNWQTLKASTTENRPGLENSNFSRETLEVDKLDSQPESQKIVEPTSVISNGHSGDPPSLYGTQNMENNEPDRVSLSRDPKVTFHLPARHMNIPPDSSSENDNGTEEIRSEPDDLSEHLDTKCKEGLLVYCRNSACSNATTVEDATENFKLCHNCSVFYCSRLCRRDHWEKHKKHCEKFRANTVARRVIDKIHENKTLRTSMSTIARRGFLALGRGAVKIFFSDTGTAETFLCTGVLPETHFQAIVNIMPQEMSSDTYKQLIELCRNYNSDIKFILYVSICTFNETPISGSNKYRRETIARCAKIRLTDPSIPSSVVSTPRPNSVDDSSSKVQSQESETLILTNSDEMCNSTRQAREDIFNNVTRELRDRGVKLREQHPEAYQKLVQYVDRGEPFPCLTIKSRNNSTGTCFTFIMTTEKSSSRSQRFLCNESKVRIVDISRPHPAIT